MAGATDSRSAGGRDPRRSACARVGTGVGDPGAGGRGMTDASHHDEDSAQLDVSNVVLPAPLAEYAERLVQSTGLSGQDVLLIASGHAEPPVGLEAIDRALRAGWKRLRWRSTAFAPVLPLANPVAVTVSGSGERFLVRAADSDGTSTATGTGALSALSERDVAIDAEEPRTLVVPIARRCVVYSRWRRQGKRPLQQPAPRRSSAGGPCAPIIRGRARSSS